MGFFSFLTVDTEESIPNVHSHQKTFPVYMIDNKGNIYEEKEYEGYGVFGGKDIFQLIAEMNNKATGDLQTDRSIGIEIQNGAKGLIKGKELYLWDKDFFNWEQDVVAYGKSANKLIKENGFDRITISYDHAVFPNLFRYKDYVKWKSHHKLKDCPFQGYFY